MFKRLLALSSIFFFNSIAMGTVTITGQSPYGTVNNNLYYVGSMSSLDQLVDENFKVLDVGGAAAGSAEDIGNIITFNVQTDQSLSPDSSERVLVLVTAEVDNGQEADRFFVPIAYSETKNCVTDDNCQIDFDGTGRNLAARISDDQQEHVVGIYLPDICYMANQGTGPIVLNSETKQEGKTRTLANCSGTILDSTVDPYQFELNIYVIKDSTSDIPTIEELNSSSETAKLTVNVQAGGPFISCPDVSSVYFPGDSQILVDTLQFVGAVVSNYSPPHSLVVVGKNSEVEDPATDSTFYSANDLVDRVPYQSGEQAVSGFTNTTTGSDNKYRLIFGVKDYAGAVNFSSLCSVTGVQSAAVTGFLEESKCFIATATYQSGTAWPVMILRQFRDRYLLRTVLGSRFVAWYYSWSPAAADWLSQNGWLRYPLMIVLAPLQVIALMTLYPFASLFLLGFLLFAGASVWRHRRSSVTTMATFIIVFLIGSGAVIDEALATSFSADLKEHIKKKDTDDEREPTEGYTQKLKQAVLKKDEEEERPNTSYLEDLQKRVQKEDIERSDEGSLREGESYSERLRKEILERDREEEKEEPKSVIKSVKDGTAEKLRAKKVGEIRNAAGISVGASVTQNISLSNGRTVSSVYGTGFVPDVTFFYKYQPYYSEWLGTVGIYGSLGLTLFRGTGQFAFELSDSSGNAFGSQSRTSFVLHVIPVTVGAHYQLNLMRIVRPYVSAGVVGAGLMETRDDSGGEKFAKVLGAKFGGGVSILLDWMSQSMAWDLYSQRGIQHYYITVEYLKTITLVGDVNYDVQGFFAGMNFEF